MPFTKFGDKITPNALLLNAAAFVIVIGGLKFAAPLVTQILLIVFITIVVAPIYYQLVRWKLPQWLALVIMIAGMSLVVFYGLAALARALTQFAKQIAIYHRGLQVAITDLSEWLANRDISIPPSTFEDILNVQNARLVTGKVMSFAGDLLSRGFIVLLIVVFILCEIATLPKRLRKVSWMNEDLWTRMVRVVEDVRHYMTIKTAISAATGGALYLGLVVLRIDSPLILGITAFALNYVPSIGSIIAAIPAILIAYVSRGIGAAWAVVILYLAVNQILGNIIEPRVMGRGFGVSPVIILFAMLFWGWVLGIVGMLLAVPLTMGARVIFYSIREKDPESQSAVLPDSAAPPQ